MKSNKTKGVVITTPYKNNRKDVRPTGFAKNPPY